MNHISNFAGAILIDRPFTIKSSSPEEEAVLNALYSLFKGRNMEFVTNWFNTMFGSLKIYFVILPYLGREQERVIIRISLENGMRIKATFQNTKNQKKDFTENIFINQPPVTEGAARKDARALEALFALCREQNITFVTNWLNKVFCEFDVYFVCLPHLTTEQEQVKFRALLEEGMEVKVTLKRPRRKKRRNKL